MYYTSWFSSWETIEYLCILNTDTKTIWGLKKQITILDILKKKPDKSILEENK